MALLDQIVDGRTELVFEYLTEGHLATTADEHGCSLVEWCAYCGDVSALKYLGLIGACFHGHRQLVRFLCEHGAKPNKKTKMNIPTGAFMRDCRTKGETPLHRAAAFGDETVIQMLLDAGAKVKAWT